MTFPLVTPFFNVLKDSDYHALPALSSSGIKHLLKSPAHYLASLKEPRIASSQMEFGTLFHMAVLEPKRFFSEVKPMPELNLRTKKGKAEFSEMQQSGIKYVDQKILDKILYMQRAARCNWVSAEYLGDPHLMCEYALVAEVDGHFHKAKPDGIVAQQHTLIDVKTTYDGAHYKFSKTIIDYGYHIQAAHYTLVARRLGLDIRNFVFISVETEAPYSCTAYDLSNEYLNLGLDQCEKAYQIYRDLPEDFLEKTYEDLVSPQEKAHTIDLPKFMKG